MRKIALLSNLVCSFIIVFASIEAHAGNLNNVINRQASERSRVNEGYNGEAKKIGKEYNIALSQFIEGKGPYPGSKFSRKLAQANEKREVALINLSHQHVKERVELIKQNNGQAAKLMASRMGVKGSAQQTSSTSKAMPGSQVSPQNSGPAVDASKMKGKIKYQSKDGRDF